MLAALIASALLAIFVAWLPRHEVAGGETQPARAVGFPATTGEATGATPDTRRNVSAARQYDDEASREGALLQAALARHLRALLRDGDARQKILALKMLGRHDLASRRRARIEAARILREAPDDPIVAQAQAWFCAGTPEGCSEADMQAWSKVEPGNAAAWAGQINAVKGDPARLDALMAQAAQGAHYESRAHEMALETVAAFDDLQLPPLGRHERRTLQEAGFGLTDAERRRLLSASYVFALPIPAMQGISRACRPPVSVRRARDCRAILVPMARASSLMERMVALGTLEKLMRGTPEGARWAQEARRLRWWYQQFSVLITGDVYWRDFLRLGEVEAVRRALLASGRPLDPPASWRPG